VYGRFLEGPRKVSSGLGSGQELVITAHQSIGTIETAIGARTLTRAGGTVAASTGDPVFPGDTIETGPNGSIAVRFIDGTGIILASSAHVVLKEFVRGSAGHLHSALLTLARGAFAFIVGRIAKSGGLTIDTPLASIRSRSSGSGIGILSIAALTFSAIEQSHAQPAGTTFLDDGEITYKDLEHGVFELRTKVNPRTIWIDNPGESVVLDKTGSSTPVTNSATEMNRLQMVQQGALANYVLGLQGGPTESTTNGSSTRIFPTRCCSRSVLFRQLAIPRKVCSTR